MLTWIGMVWTKLIIVVEINSPRPSSVMGKGSQEEKTLESSLDVQRGCPGFPARIDGPKDRKRKPIVGRAFATAKESWSQLGTSYRNWDICLLLMTETIATARKIVSSQRGKRRERRQCWSVGEKGVSNSQPEVFTRGLINLLFRAGWMFREETSWNISPRGSC